VGKKKKLRQRPNKFKVYHTLKKEYVFPEEIKCPKCKKHTIKIKLTLRKNHPFGKKSKARKSIKEKKVFCINRACKYVNAFNQPPFGEKILLVIL